MTTTGNEFLHLVIDRSDELDEERLATAQTFFEVQLSQHDAPDEREPFEEVLRTIAGARAASPSLWRSLIALAVSELLRGHAETSATRGAHHENVAFELFELSATLLPLAQLAVDAAWGEDRELAREELVRGLVGCESHELKAGR